jgi:predicted RNA-binding Zn-ribbon protein involved in translation (DUF1610 family)
MYKIAEKKIRCSKCGFEFIHSSRVSEGAFSFADNAVCPNCGHSSGWNPPKYFIQTIIVILLVAVLALSFYLLAVCPF